MTPAQFQARWLSTSRSEKSAAQEHFLDLCALIGHKRPSELDSTGDLFTFERYVQTREADGTQRRGYADVWKRGFFAWEYKGPHKNLDLAYAQLQRYREELLNPPLLVVSDLETILIHTNFTNTPRKTHRVSVRSIDEPTQLATLRDLFFHPEQLKPDKTIETVTRV